MVIQLNPTLPVVWRSPDTIQVGIDRPVAVVTGVTPGLEAVLWALRCGLPRSGAILVGTEAGASVAAVERLIDELGPALRTSEPSAGGPGGPRPIDTTRLGTVLVDGVGPTADRLRALLGDLDLPVVSAPDPDPCREPVLAVLIGHYVLEPARHMYWLRRDVPQLPVVFGDAEVRLGPLVEPGVGPCLVCVEFDHVDRDEAWPAIASQLVRRRAETETPALAAAVAARAALLVLARVTTGSSELTGTRIETPSLVIDTATGQVTRRAHRPHARCGCRSLSEIASVPGPNAAADRAWTS